MNIGRCPQGHPVIIQAGGSPSGLELAKNFLNQKEFDKAEEHVKRVLEKMPEGKLADEAKALQKEIHSSR